jgi:hypothetical protein
LGLLALLTVGEAAGGRKGGAKTEVGRRRFRGEEKVISKKSAASF